MSWSTGDMNRSNNADDDGGTSRDSRGNRDSLQEDNGWPQPSQPSSAQTNESATGWGSSTTWGGSNDNGWGDATNTNSGWGGATSTSSEWGGANGWGSGAPSGNTNMNTGTSANATAGTGWGAVGSGGGWGDDIDDSGDRGTSNLPQSPTQPPTGWGSAPTNRRQQGPRSGPASDGWGPSFRNNTTSETTGWGAPPSASPNPGRATDPRLSHPQGRGRRTSMNTGWGPFSGREGDNGPSELSRRPSSSNDDNPWGGHPPPTGPRSPERHRSRYQNNYSSEYDPDGSKRKFAHHGGHGAPFPLPNRDREDGEASENISIQQSDERSGASKLLRGIAKYTARASTSRAEYDKCELMIATLHRLQDKYDGEASPEHKKRLEDLLLQRKKHEKHLNEEIQMAAYHWAQLMASHPGAQGSGAESAGNWAPRAYGKHQVPMESTSECQHQCSDLDIKLRAFKLDMDHDMSRLRSTSVSESAVEKLQKRNEELAERVAQLEADKVRAADDLAKTQEKVRELEKRIEERFPSDPSVLATRLGVLEAVVSEHRQEVGRWMAKTENARASLQDQVSDFTQAVPMLSRAIDEIDIASAPMILNMMRSLHMTVRLEMLDLLGDCMVATKQPNGGGY